jgi:hypothetical protein
MVRPRESSPEVAAAAAYPQGEDADSMDVSSPTFSPTPPPDAVKSEYAEILQLPEFQDDPILTILEKKLQDACDGKPDLLPPDPSLHIPLKLTMSKRMGEGNKILTGKSFK